MKIIVHRGSKQIGGTCIEVQSGKTRILLDIGLPLDADLSKLREKDMGQNLIDAGILPKLNGLYKWDKGSAEFDSILISHLHLDHYGILEFVKPEIPIYLAKSSKEMLIKFLEILPGTPDNAISNYSEINNEDAIQIGSFHVKPFLMDHSAFSAYAFHISDDEKQLFYSGDFRGHGRKQKAFQWFLHNAPHNIDALLIEGTMLSRPGEKVKTETELENEMIEVIKKAQGFVLAWCSSQNIDRLTTIYRAAKRSGRIFAVDIYTAHMLGIAGKYAGTPVPDNRFPDMKVYFPWRLSTRLADEGKQKLLYEYQKVKITKEEMVSRKDKMVMFIRPSVQLDLEKMGGLNGASLIYSLWEGYLKEPYTRKFVSWLKGKGVTMQSIHTSGHAPIEDLKKMVQAINPSRIIPIHSECPGVFKDHFSNVELAKDGKDIII